MRAGLWVFSWAWRSGVSAPAGARSFRAPSGPASSAIPRAAQASSSAINSGAGAGELGMAACYGGGSAECQRRSGVAEGR